MLPLLNSWLPHLSLILVVGALALNWRSQRQLARWQIRYHQDIERLEKQLNMMNSGSIGMGQRMLALEQKVMSLQSQRADSKPADTDFSYSHAMQMFDRGVDAAAVAASCGISRSEAQLMELIRKQVKPPPLAASA